MPMNMVQFQRGGSLVEFLERFGTEEACVAALTNSRWPEGFVCPRCSLRSSRSFLRGRQRLHQCNACGYQASLLVGTLLESTKVPLRVWFLAAYLLTQTKTNVSALELRRHLGVAYNTAWRIKHKLMQLMCDHESSRKLKGLVQIDDAYLGGELNGGTAGRGSENKVPILIAVSTSDDGHPLRVVVSPIAGFSKLAIGEWADRHLAPGCEVYTDGLGGFRALEDNHARTIMETAGRRAACTAPGATWVSTVLGNIKRAIDGRYHAFAFRKYAERYLSEAAWRFNRRFHLDSIAADLLGGLTHCGPWSEGKLRHQFRGC